jgi:hypothetical protein
MIIGEMISVYPLINQLNMLINILVDHLKIYLEAVNG